MLTSLLSLPKSRYFWAERESGRYACGNPEGYYLTGADPEQASYDTGNNRVITLSGLNGELKSLTIFKESYFADNIPGVWVHKGRILAGPFGFGLADACGTRYLPDYEGRVRTDLIECVIPATTYALDGLEATAVAFAPLSADGGERPRGAFYLLHVKNTSDMRRQGEILLPDMGHFSTTMERGDNAQVDILLPATFAHASRVAFDLAPGACACAEVWLGVYGEAPCERIRLGAAWWLEQTLAYYRALAGGLCIEDQPFLEEFMKRTLHQCQMCIGMDASGKLAGSSWGTNPTTYQIWMKDMYYSMLPLAQTDPDLFLKGVEWFAEYGVRPAGVQFEGGVKHSLSNSLSAVLMAGQYYAATGDARYFREHPALVGRLNGILDEMIASREKDDVWLMPSIWISDGLAMGDFHTGSNITAWAALTGFARILDEALGETGRAETLRQVAARVKEAILSLCVTDEGPFGRQLTEGVGKGSEALQARMKADSLEEFLQKNSAFGVQFYEFYNHPESERYLVHDGEETDTTLLPFYGMMAYDDPLYKNYTRFAMTEHNRFYCPVSRGILWEDCTDSTFPGYVTGMANTVDAESFRAHFEPIARLADLDGSIWWWPYKHQATDSSEMKRVPGKCGWASGALLALLWHDILGVRYDGAARTLTLAPLDALGEYHWPQARLGGGMFDICTDGRGASVKNLNSFAVTLRLRLFGEKLTRNGCELATSDGVYLGRPCRECEILLLPGERAEVR